MRISDWSSDVCSSDLRYSGAEIVDPGSISLICRVRGDLAPDPFIEQIVDNRLPCVVKARPRHRLVEMLVVRVNQGAGLVCPRTVECNRAALEQAIHDDLMRRH